MTDPTPIFKAMNLDQVVTFETDVPEKKLSIWDEELVTIVIILTLIAYDYIRKEWREFGAKNQHQDG